MRIAWLLISFSTVLLWNATARAELDLAIDSKLEVSGVTDVAGLVAEATEGRAALRDNDPDTAWTPPEGDSAWIELDLSSDGRDIRLELDRVEIDWGEHWARTVTLSGGPDRYTQTVLSSLTVSDPTSAVLTPTATLNSVRYLRVVLEGSGVSVARLSVFAKTAPLLGLISAPTINGKEGILEVNWDAIDGAHHYEVERNESEGAIVHLFNSTSPKAFDRPINAGNVTYRVRGIDYNGEAGEWSSAVSVTGYDPNRPQQVSMSGVVEGYYGHPWSHRKRLEIIRWMGVWGLNTYVYAPKNDKKHRDQWRGLYDESELDRFAELAETGTEAGVNVIYGISPGKDIDPLLANDFSALTAKLSQLISIGITHFALLMDDISVSINATSGANQAALVNNLATWLENKLGSVDLLFVPTVYSGTAGSFDQNEIDYLQALQGIQPGIPIGWTGQGTFDAEITAEEVISFRELVEHPVWIWDNYPVNDFDLGLGMYLAPIEGRSPAMLDEIAGILCNPMIEGIASLFAISSYAELLNDPQNYGTSTRGAEKIRMALDPMGDGESLWKLQDLFSENIKLFPERESLSELSENIDTLLTALDLKSESEIAEIHRVIMEDLLELLNMADDLAFNLPSRDLSDELALRMEKLKAKTYGAHLAIQLLQAELYGVRDSFSKAENRLETMQQGYYTLLYPIAENSLGHLIEVASGEERTPLAARFLGQADFTPMVNEPLGMARQGQEWTFDAGFRMPTELEWSVDTSPDIDAQVDDNGLVSLLANKNEEPSTSQRMHHWVHLAASQGDSVQHEIFELEITPALAEEATPGLELSTELQDVDGVAALLQNGEVMPDLASSTYSRQSLAGVWKKRRMCLDHRLTFQARTAETLRLLAAESGGAILPEYDDTEWEEIQLPSVENHLAPSEHPSGAEKYWEGVWYRREVSAPTGAKRVRLVMISAGYIVDVWANGLYLGHHEGASTPFLLPLPYSLADQGSIVLTLRVDNPEPGYFAGMLPYRGDTERLAYAGVMHDLYWEYLPSDKRAVLAAVHVIPESAFGSLRVEAIVEGLGSSDFTGKIEVEVFEMDERADGYWENAPLSTLLVQDMVMGLDDEMDIDVRAGKLSGISMQAIARGSQDWSPLDPETYVARVNLRTQSGGLLDRAYIQTGFRTVAVVEDGQFEFNDSVAFLPGIGRVEDSPESGCSMSWNQLRRDLSLIRENGALLMNGGLAPNHPQTPILADRLGLTMVSGIAAWGLDQTAYQAQLERPLALQMWREMIFSRRNRPSVIFWNLCTRCESVSGENGTAAFIRSLADDMQTHYPDGRLLSVTLAADEENLDDSGLDLADIAGLSALTDWSEDEVESQSLTAIETLRERFPEKPVLLAEFGTQSEYDGSGMGNQVSIAENSWNAVLAHSQVNPDRIIVKDGYLMGAVWKSMFDWYDNEQGLRTDGLYYMDRQLAKPSAETIRTLYAPFQRRAYSSGTGGDYDFKGSDGCRQMNQTQNGFWLLLLLLLALHRFGRRNPENN